LKKSPFDKLTATLSGAAGSARRRYRLLERKLTPSYGKLPPKSQVIREAIARQRSGIQSLGDRCEPAPLL